MSSGKQLSFAFGEVSPALRFRADVPFYSQALRKLHNGIVRKSGGVSNRSGSKLVDKPEYQLYLADKDSGPGVRIFPVYYGTSFYLIELKAVLPMDASTPLRGYNMNAETTGGAYFDIPATFDLRFGGEVYDLSKASMSQLNGSLAISVPRSGFDGMNFINDIKTFFVTLGNFAGTYTSVFPKPVAIGTYTSGSTVISCYGVDPQDIPVSYLITQEQDDGSEVFWVEFKSAVCHPHLENAVTLTPFDAHAGNGIKQYNVYRSAGGVGDASQSSHYALVGRVAASSTTATFRDFAVTPDLTVQPPTDEYLYPPTGFIKKIFYYKERAIILYKNYRAAGATQDKYSVGQFAASKIGAPKMFGRPLTPNLIDAFSATIPTDKIGDLTNYLVINRLLLFTKDISVVIRGGENGVLTSAQVNPEVVYHEGAADDITPVASGTRGFFIPPDKSKLLMIKYSPDDSLSIVDISILSDHLFEARDIRRMAMITGFDNILWMLKKDGTLISLTVSEEGAIQGFATHAMAGFVEDICSQEIVARNYASGQDQNTAFTNRAQSLIVSIIRDGVRYYETMAVRNDYDFKNFLYADSSVLFGFQKPDGLMAVNITTATTYAAGQLLTLTDVLSSTFMSTRFPVNSKIDFPFSYTEENEYGEEVLVNDVLRITIASITNTNVVKGYSETDVPAVFRNVAAQSLTAAQKLKLQKSYLKGYKVINGLTHLAGKKVSVYADGQMISSPLNEEVESLTVSDAGVLTLPDFYNWGYVGLPYVFEMETLDLEASDARTFTDVGKLINKVGVGLRNTQGGRVGQSGKGVFDTFEKLSDREEENFTVTTKPISGYTTVAYPSTWDMTGRLTIKQIDPLPITVLAVYPKGVAGE